MKKVTFVTSHIRYMLIDLFLFENISFPFAHVEARELK